MNKPCFECDMDLDKSKILVDLAFFSSVLVIMKTCLYKFDPIKLHFYIVKLGFTEVYFIFLFLSKNID